ERLLALGSVVYAFASEAHPDLEGAARKRRDVLVHVPGERVQVTGETALGIDDPHVHDVGLDLLLPQPREVASAQLERGPVEPKAIDEAGGQRVLERQLAEAQESGTVATDRVAAHSVLLCDVGLRDRVLLAMELLRRSPRGVARGDFLIYLPVAADPVRAGEQAPVAHEAEGRIEVERPCGLPGAAPVDRRSIAARNRRAAHAAGQVRADRIGPAVAEDVRDGATVPGDEVGRDHLLVEEGGEREALDVVEPHLVLADRDALQIAAQLVDPVVHGRQGSPELPLQRTASKDLDSGAYLSPPVADLPDVQRLRAGEAGGGCQVLIDDRVLGLLPVLRYFEVQALVQQSDVEANFQLFTPLRTQLGVTNRPGRKYYAGAAVLRGVQPRRGERRRLPSGRAPCGTKPQLIQEIHPEERLLADYPGEARLRVDRRVEL